MTIKRKSSICNFSRKLWFRGLLTLNRVAPLFIDPLTTKRHKSNTLTPIFVIGPPRSGSTLLMQVLTDAFNVGYLTNQHCQWFGAPAIADRILNPLAAKRPSNYKSRHGRTEQMSDPAECGAWWYRFFRREPAYVTKQDVNPRKMRAFRHSLQALEEAMERPLVFKNLYASLRIEPIVQHVPNALFVIVERDLVDNAQSILKGRMDALGSYEPWWSIPPPNAAELQSLKPVQQAAEQVRSVHSLITNDIERLELKGQTFRLNYETFCQDVHGTLKDLKQFALKNNVTLSPRFEVPAHFETRHDRKIPDAMYEELVNYVQKTAGIPTDKATGVTGGY